MSDNHEITMAPDADWYATNIGGEPECEDCRVLFLPLETYHIVHITDADQGCGCCFEDYDLDYCGNCCPDCKEVSSTI